MIELESLIRYYPENIRGFKRYILAEYLQCRVLSLIYASGFGAKLKLIGGTAIRLCHESLRFSEDLDFDNTGLSRNDFQRMSDMVAKELGREGYRVEHDFSFKGAFRCFLRFPGLYHSYALSNHREDKLILQMDAEAQGLEYPHATMVINKCGVFARVVLPEPGVLLSMKLAALLTRKRTKGRDFYDVTYLAPLAKPDYSFLKEKMGILNGAGLKKALWKRIAGLDMQAVTKDVSPFLFRKEDEMRVSGFGEFVESWKI